MHKMLMMLKQQIPTTDYSEARIEEQYKQEKLTKPRLSSASSRSSSLYRTGGWAMHVPIISAARHSSMICVEFMS